MTLKKQNALLIETLKAVRPLIGRGLITVGSFMMSGGTAIDNDLKACEPKQP
jgi:hypothetical protein